MTGPITQPPGLPPTVPPKAEAMHRPSLAYEPHIDVTRPYVVVDGVHGWVTA